MDTRSTRIIAFPRAGNIYTEELYKVVAARGMSITEGHWSLGWLRSHVRRGDLVHLHWPSFLYFEPGSAARTALRLAKLFAGLKLLKARGATLVWTAHNLYPHEGGAGLLSHRLGRRITLAFADRVIVHGQSAAELVAREFKVPAAKLRVAHHPHWIDLYENSVTRAAGRVRLGIAADDYLYLHIGRCKPYKGLEALIQAFRAVPPGARLIIAGNFSEPRYLDEITALTRQTPTIGLVPRSISDQELQVYLNAADCVVLPYRAILTSGTALLALSFGRPVIAPDLGSMRDHVDADSGLLYDPERPDALRDALIEIRSRRYDPAAILAHARRFTWEALADALTE